MQLGMIGLGRMGANMVRRLLKGGHQCVVFNRSPKPVAELVKQSGRLRFARGVGQESDKTPQHLVDGAGRSGGRHH
jgi:6-phosphogluconate dehydrogenase (decarboxylating)